MQFGLYPQTGLTQMVKQHLNYPLCLNFLNDIQHNDLVVSYCLFEPIDRFLFRKYKINFILQYMVENNLSHELSVNMFDNYKEEVISCDLEIALNLMNNA